MGHAFTSDIAFSESVKRVQVERGSRRSYAKMETLRGGFAKELTPEVGAFIAERDSAYLATASAAAQPYVQHRGGPVGFLNVLDASTIAFADFTGNRQYITTGNLAENDRAFLFLMNYAQGERVKIWGRAQIVRDDPELIARIADPAYEAKIEQGIVFHVDAWDVNCPQHIPKLVHAEHVAAQLRTYERRIAHLEATLRSAGVSFTATP